jgi:hypothetical protein
MTREFKIFSGTMPTVAERLRTQMSECSVGVLRW